MKFLRSLVSIPLLSLPTIISANCNPESCAGALGGAIVPSVPAAVAAESATIGGCVAATLISIILPALAPVSMVCWGLAAIEPAITAGGPIALAGLAGGCFDCTAAKPCDKNDEVARSHGCGGDGGDAAKLTLGPNKCAQLSSSVLNPGPDDAVIEPEKGPHGVPKGPGYTFHCGNNGLVTDKSHTTCYWDCSWCTDQCAGKGGH